MEHAYNTVNWILPKLKAPAYARFKDTSKICVYLRKRNFQDLCISKYLQMVSSRLVDAAEAMKNGKVSVIAPLDLKGCKIKKSLSIKGGTVEETRDFSLQIEAIEGGGFVNRLLSREEEIGNSFRSYYRAPLQGRVPFEWEAEPGKPKTDVSKEDESDHRVPLLSPPPILRARNDDDFCKSSNPRRKVGFFQKIKEFLQGKPLAKSTKLRQRRGSTPGDLIRDPEQGTKYPMRRSSVGVERRRPDWKIYGDTGENSGLIAFSSHRISI